MYTNNKNFQKQFTLHHRCIQHIDVVCEQVVIGIPWWLCSIWRSSRSSNCLLTTGAESSSTRAIISPSSTTNSSLQVCDNIIFRASNQATQQDGKTPIHEHLEYMYLAITRAVIRILKGAGKYKRQEKSKKRLIIPRSWIRVQIEHQSQQTWKVNNFCCLWITEPGEMEKHYTKKWWDS